VDSNPVVAFEAQTSFARYLRERLIEILALLFIYKIFF